MRNRTGFVIPFAILGAVVCICTWLINGALASESRITACETSQKYTMITLEEIKDELVRIRTSIDAMRDDLKKAGR